MPRRATSTSFGGIAGNKGNTTIPGPGRPSNLVRERAAWSWEQRIPRLEKIADGKLKKGTIQDSIAALRELRAVGFAERQEHTFPDLPRDEAVNRVAALLAGARQRKPSNGSSNGNGVHSNGNGVNGNGSHP